jgi:lipoate-protein ligase B
VGRGSAVPGDVRRRDALFVSLGVVPYARGLELQRQLWQLRVGGEIPDTLLLLEHPPVLTLGKSGEVSSLLVSESELAKRRIELHRVERGGDITFHGPGQLVGYPFMHLKEGLVGVRQFVARLEQALVVAAAGLGVKAGTRPGFVGVWCGDRKLVSIGIAVKRWVTFHGFALNVSTDLSQFSIIHPCGLERVKMTSIKKEGGQEDDAAVRRAVKAGFERVFGLRFQSKPPRSLTSLTKGLKRSAMASASDFA